MSHSIIWTQITTGTLYAKRKTLDSKNESKVFCLIQASNQRVHSLRAGRNRRVYVSNVGNGIDDTHDDYACKRDYGDGQYEGHNDFKLLVGEFHKVSFLAYKPKRIYTPLKNMMQTK